MTHRFWLALGLACTMLAATTAWAKPAGREVTYKSGDVTLKGYLVEDAAKKGKRPAVLVVHEWWGHNEYARKRARMLADQGYVALAVDMFGDGKTAQHPKEAGAFAGEVMKNKAVGEARFNAALDFIRQQPTVDATRIAAIGYCFGGTTVLELARSGAPVAGVVSFHGGLATKEPADAKNVRGRILVLHGAADPYVPPAEVAAFQKEMDDAKVDWQMVYYSGAVHSFTQPHAGSDPSKGAAYDAKADARSWEAMKSFLAERSR